MHDLKQKDIDLSIIIVNYNTRDQTVDCIRSIYEKTSDITFEIIIVDNNSSDGSCEVIQKHFDEVIIIVNSDNLGFAKGANVGARNARGKYFCFLNSDTNLVNNAMREMLDVMNANRQIGIAGPLILDPEMGINQSLLNISISGTLLRLLGIKRMIKINENFLSNHPRGYELTMGTGLIGACILVRRDLFEALGGFDEQFFFYWEESDFILNAMRNRWKAVFLPAGKVIHDTGGTVRKLSLEERKNVVYHFYYGLLFYCRKNYGKLGFVLARFTTRVIIMVKRYHYMVKWKKKEDIASKFMIYSHVLEKLYLRKYH
ncbi:MAG: glycosyltransferase [Deltaproteobacteria bacterium]|nr:glycosyltransferase [Deltaproteobacteria bacterium]